MAYQLPSTTITDGYKLSHSSQYYPGTTLVASNMTPRDFKYGYPQFDGGKADHMVYIGIQYAIKRYLIDAWNDTFFNQPKDKAIKAYTRRLNNYMGPGKCDVQIASMAALHDLGYLPIRIKSLPEGSRVNAKIPVFLVNNTHPDFFWLTNYLETVLSATIWPMCNSASLSEQYYLLSKEFGEVTGASAEYWLPFANHNFSMRGMRGIEDATMSGAAALLFSKGTDTLTSIDFLEEYYNADSDKEFIAGSVNASEHATVTQNIAIMGSEKPVLHRFLTQLYPTGIISYVADSIDYFDLVSRIIPELKEEILARQPDHNGMPGKLVLRPDSSEDTPLEIIVGYSVYEAEAGITQEMAAYRAYNDDRQLAKYEGKYYRVVRGDYDEHILGAEVSEPQAKGTLQLLWDTFGGEEVTGRDGKKYRMIDSHIGMIYGEAISLHMANRIYSAMEARGWCVGNVLFGVGSYSFLGGSTRDSYGMAMKATFSIVGDELVEQSKSPKTSSFKASAKGLLRVEFEDGKFVLYDQQTPQQSEGGLLETIFKNGVMIKETSLSEMRALVGI
jgi:nicotinamide phosphoribosyltransferase